MRAIVDGIVPFMCVVVGFWRHAMLWSGEWNHPHVGVVAFGSTHDGVVVV